MKLALFLRSSLPAAIVVSCAILILAFSYDPLHLALIQNRATYTLCGGRYGGGCTRYRIENNTAAVWYTVVTKLLLIFSFFVALALVLLINVSPKDQWDELKNRFHLKFWLCLFIVSFLIYFFINYPLLVFWVSPYGEHWR